MPTIDYKGHRLTWQAHSPGEETFIFIHGFSVPRQSWLPELNHYTDLGRCVTLDLPGHGLAQTPAEYKHLSQSDFIDLMTHAVQEIAPTGPLTLIGHSTGGLVALSVAARLPHRVQRVVSSSAVVWGPLTGLLGVGHRLLRAKLYPIFAAMWGSTKLHPASMVFGLSFYVADRWAIWRNPVAWASCRLNYHRYRRQALRNLAVTLNFLDTCDIRPLVAGLQTPTLILTGDSDPVVHPSQAHWLAQNLPQSELHVFPSAGHALAIETPQTYAQTVRGWLESTA